MKKILLWSLLFAGASLSHADFIGSENFAGTYQDVLKWDPPISEGQGYLAQTGGVLKFANPDATGEGFMAWPWAIEGSFDESWAVQVDVNVPMITLADGHTAVGMGVGVRNAQDEEDFLGISLEHLRSTGQPQQFVYTAGLDINGTSTTETSAPASATLGAVRIEWNADTQVLITQYDSDGPTNGYSWTTLSVFDPVNNGWDMDGSNTFEIIVAGYSELTSVALTKNVYADNFKVESQAPRNLFGGSTFTDGTSNTIQFGEDRGIDATLTQTGGRLAFEQSAPGNGTATTPWLPNTGSFTEDWEATVDLHVDDFAAADGAVRMGLYVEAGGSVAGVRLGLEKSGGTPTREFSWEDASPGGASGSASATLADGSVRFLFDSTDKTLNCYYDANGYTDGYSWTLLGSLDVDDPGSDWGLTNDSRFHIWLSGESDTPVTPANAWADNFRCVSDYIPPFLSTPTGFEDFSATGKRTHQWAPDDVIVGNASLNQIGDGSVRTITVAESESIRGWVWQSNGSFGASWSVQADLNVPFISLAPDGSAGMGIAVINSADPNDRLNVGLENGRPGAGAQEFHFVAGVDVNGTSTETTAAAGSAIGAVRIAWSHTAKQLTAAYDPDGPANGYNWTVFRTFSPAGAANWNMMASNSFRIALYGSAEETAVTANHNFYADNFAVFGATTTLLPVVKTTAATPPFLNGATMNGSVNAKGVARAVYFDWGTTTAYGSSMPADTPIADGSSNTLFFGEVTNLQPHTKYNYRIRATSALGTALGANMTFTTANSIPVGVADNFPVLPGAVTMLPVLLNDTDADSDALTVLSNTALTPAAAGKLSKSGSNIVFTAAANFSAPATFTYIAKDAFGGKTAAITVTLTPVSSTLNFTQAFPLAAAGNVAVGGYELTINTTGAWSVVENLPWVSVSTTSGRGTSTISVIVQPNNSLSPRSGTITVGGQPHVISQAAAQAAVISLVAPPDPALVGAPYLLQVNVDNAPVVFTVKNLPPGLTLNPVTYEITGTPTKAGSYDVTLKGKNAAGDAVTTDMPATTTLAFTIVVEQLRNAFVGTFHGLISAHPDFNGNLGARLEMTITSTGAMTGKVITGATSQPIKAQLQVNPADPDHPTMMVSVPKKNDMPDVLDLVFDHDTQSVAGVFTNLLFVDGAPLTGWRNSWTTTHKPDAFAILHTFAMEQVLGNPIVPQGTGIGSFKPDSKTGALTVTGKLPDGSTLTSSTFVGEYGQVLVYCPLYGNKGVACGVITIIENGSSPTDNDLYCHMNWYKPAAAPTAKDNVYPWGVDPIPLTIDGGAYNGILPGQVVMGLDGTVANNATLVFGGGVLADLVDFNINASVTNPSATGVTNKVALPTGPANPNAVKMSTLNPATGAFTGEFTLFGTTTALNRKVTFQGQIVDSPYWGVVGVGYALVPEEIVPPYTAATALRYSVPVVFMPAGP